MIRLVEFTGAINVLDSSNNGLMMARCGFDMKELECVCIDCWNFSHSFTTWGKYRTWWYCMDSSGNNNFPKRRQYKEKGLPVVKKCKAFIGSPANTIIARGWYGQNSMRALESCGTLPWLFKQSGRPRRHNIVVMRNMVLQVWTTWDVTYDRWLPTN